MTTDPVGIGGCGGIGGTMGRLGGGGGVRGRDLLTFVDEGFEDLILGGFAAILGEDPGGGVTIASFASATC